MSLVTAVRDLLMALPGAARPWVRAGILLAGVSLQITGLTRCMPIFFLGVGLVSLTFLGVSERH